METNTTGRPEARLGEYWIPLRSLRERWNLDSEQLGRVLKSDRLTVRRFPGVHPRVLMADVERCEREWTTPAVVPELAGV